MALDFRYLTAKDIFNVMEEKATKEQKADFKKAAFPLTSKKTSSKVFDTAGNPVMYQVKDKDGNPKLDKDGKPVLRQKVKMVETANEEQTAKFSLLAAKWWFAEKFPDEVTNVPERKKEEETKAGDLFANW